MKKILVLGYFGHENNQLDGQTIKTRSIYELLRTKIKDFFEVVDFFDTQSLKTSKLNILKLIRSFAAADIIIYIPAQNNLLFLFPIIFVFAKIMGIKLHYVVVGGWLVEFLKGKSLHLFFLKRISAIYPQSTALATNLKKEYGLENIVLLPNFRNHNYKPVIAELDEKVKLVFLARVHPLKGVDVIFKLAKVLEERRITTVSIHLYGQINAGYKENFLMEESRYSCLNYMGIVQPSDIYKTLNSYDLMLFPTQFFTEGFPGSILDAYTAGIPVIASKWKHASEFIENNVSGLITEFGNDDDFIQTTISLIENPDRIYRMKFNAFEESLKYSSEKAWEILKNTITKAS